MANIVGKSDQYPTRTLNSTYGTPVCELYIKKWHSVDVLAHPKLKAKGLAGESAAM